jgi:hypothetical protein
MKCSIFIITLESFEMKVLYFVILFIMVTIQSGIAQQQAPEIEWEKTFGGSESEYGRSIIQTNDGGYAVCGNAWSKGAESRNIRVIKLDSQGRQIWEKTYGEPKRALAFSIIQIEDGSYALCGHTTSGRGVEDYDFLVIKLDRQGNLLWDRTFGSSSFDQAYSIIQTTEGGFAICGTKYSKKTGSSGFCVIKLDRDGKLIWEKTFDGPNKNVTSTDVAYSIVPTTDSGYAVCGYSTKRSKEVQFPDFWVIKLNHNGKLIWDKTFGGSGTDEASTIIQTIDGGYALCGTTSSKGAGQMDIWVIKLDDQGNLIWDKTLGGSKSEWGRSITQTTDSSYVLCGVTSSKGAGSGDIWVIKLDSQGNLIWDKALGGSKSENGRSITQTTDGGYALCGRTKSKGAGDYDIWVMKLEGDERTLAKSDQHPPIQPPPTRPPKLQAEIQFSDQDQNNILEAEEKGDFKIMLSNTGEGLARGIKVKVDPRLGQTGIEIGKDFSVGDINPGQSKSIDIPIEGTVQLADGFTTFDFSFPEANGFDADPISLKFETRALRPPELIIADIGIDDANNNGKIEPVEIVEVTARVKNSGEGKARAVNAQVKLGANLFVAAESKTSFNLGDMEPGDWQNITFSFYTNKKIQEGTLPISVSLTDSRHRWDKEEALQLALNVPTRRREEIIITGEKPETRTEDQKTEPSLTSEVDQNIPKTKMKNPNAIAVVIGNRDYDHVPNVDYALRDANTVKDYLVNMLGYKPDNVLLKENVTLSDFVYLFGTREDYKGRLYNMIKQGQSDLLIYYTGHGAPHGDKGYLLPVNCRPTRINTTGYSRDLLYENLSRIPARTITVVIDACFNGRSAGGTITQKASPVKASAINPLITKDNTTLFLSSSGMELSYWYPEKKHSLFTYYFLKGLRGEADADNNRTITTGELYEYLCDQSEGVPYRARSLNDAEQTPQLIGVNRDRVLVEF